MEADRIVLIQKLKNLNTIRKIHVKTLKNQKLNETKYHNLMRIIILG